MTHKQPETGDRVCERIELGESLNSICKDPDMPSMVTVHRWIDADDGFRSKYARATSIRADRMAEEILEIADDASNDWLEKNGEGAVGWALNGEHVQRSRLRIESRKWLMAKMHPKKYSERSIVDNNHGVTDQFAELLAHVAAGSKRIGS